MESRKGPCFRAGVRVPASCLQRTASFLSRQGMSAIVEPYSEVSFRRVSKVIPVRPASSPLPGRREFLQGLSALLGSGLSHSARAGGVASAGACDHARAETALVRLLRQARVRPFESIRAGHGGRFRAPHSRPRGHDRRRHGRSWGGRSLDRLGQDPRVVLAAGLHAPVGARLENRGDLERPRGGSVRLSHHGCHHAHPADAPLADLCDQP